MPAPTKGPVRVTLRGPLFTKNIPRVFEEQIISELMEKVEKRVRRKGRKIGRKNNPIEPGELTLRSGVTLVMTSTTKWPRTSGGSWTRKNVAAIKSMAPRVICKTARRIADELGGS